MSAVLCSEGSAIPERRENQPAARTLKPLKKTEKEPGPENPQQTEKTEKEAKT